MFSSPPAQGQGRYLRHRGWQAGIAVGLVERFDRDLDLNKGIGRDLKGGLIRATSPSHRGGRNWVSIEVLEVLGFELSLIAGRIDKEEIDIVAKLSVAGDAEAAILIGFNCDKLAGRVVSEDHQRTRVHRAWTAHGGTLPILWNRHHDTVGLLNLRRREVTGGKA